MSPRVPPAPVRPWIRPAPLAPGDSVLVVSPSGPVLPDLLAPGLEMLRAWGLRPIEHSTLYARKSPPHGYLAGGDTTRLSALEEALYGDQFKAIWCSRGGYGAMRLLPHLDAQKARAHPKLLVGFSDATALHFWMTQCAQIASLHGPVIKSLPKHPKGSDTLEHLKDAIFGLRTPRRLRFEGLRGLTQGQATGRLIGGNLSLVAALLGSPYCPDLSGCLLFLEEVAEADYRLDRLMTTLWLCGQRPAGLILGDFTQCQGVYAKATQIPALLGSLAKDFGIPAVLGFPIGHDSHNIPLPHGSMATLDASKGTLCIHHDAAADLQTLGTPRP